MEESDRPTSTEAFELEFARLFEKDVYLPFIELTYWGESSDEQKRKYLEGVQQTFTMPSQVNRATIKDAPEDIELITVKQNGDYGVYPTDQGENVEVVPDATHVLRVTGHFDDSLSVFNSFAVGEWDGKFYFCSIAHE